MKKASISLSQRIQGSGLYRLYNVRSEGGRGRFCMLMNGIFSGIVGQLSGGVFYSGFLIEYGFDYSSISILLLLPYITTALYMFSPWILEHFKVRKWILAAAKIAVYLFQIIGITLLPMLFEKGPDGKIIDMAGMQAAFIAIILIYNTINALFSSGYTAWHANFLPDDVRADYFTSSSCINSLFSYATVFVLSLITDSVKNTSSYLTVLTAMRFLAFALAILDVAILLIPKEYEYPTSVEKVKLSNVFSLPFKNRRFMLTILIVMFATFASNIHAGYVDAFIIDTINVPYSLVNGINAVYFLFFIIFGTMWKKFIAKMTWFRALGYASLIEAPTYLLYSLISPNALALYTIVRLLQHVCGVIRNTILGSLPYVNLPDSDRTNYLSFYNIANNASAFISRLCGLLIYNHIGNVHIGITIGEKFFGVDGAVPFLILCCGILEACVAAACFALFRKVTPENLLTEYDNRVAAKKARKAQKKLKKV